MKTFTSNNKYRCSRGFTLIETLAVMGIMASMLAMVVPAINDVMNSKGRKAAVNILLNTFEQARVAALEQSTNVYVGFADRNISAALAAGGSQIVPYTRFIIFRDSNPDTDGSSAPPYIALTKWLKLPDGIAFKSGAATVADAILGNVTSGASATIPITAAAKFPSIALTYNMPVLKFNSTGAIETPNGGAGMWLFIYEGFYSGGPAGQDVFTRKAGETTGLFERISFARYTGRAQLDITSLSGV